MKFQQIIFALIRIIQVLISLKYTLLNIIPKSLVTLQFLKFLIFQIKAYIQGFQMRYQSFLGHWYPNSYSWFSDSIDILFVPITTVVFMPDAMTYFREYIGAFNVRSFAAYCCKSWLQKQSIFLVFAWHVANAWGSNNRRLHSLFGQRWTDCFINICSKPWIVYTVNPWKRPALEWGPPSNKTHNIAWDW